MAHQDGGNFLAAYSDAELQFLTRIIKRQGAAWDSWGSSKLGQFFKRWSEASHELRAKQQVAEERLHVKEILRTSERGNRSDEDKAVLRRFCLKLQVFPKELTESQLDELCNNVDFYPVEGKSLVFLQGDFGNVYYVIAVGEVALYLQPSKDQEMEIAREFGHQRGKPFVFAFEERFFAAGGAANARASFMDPRSSMASMGTVGSEASSVAAAAAAAASVLDPAFVELKRKEELSRLGIHIVTLKAGFGFGEAAILSTKSKLRGASAFSATDDTFLLVLHADVYNVVLKQVHYRQKQLASCTSLLKELPLFQHYPYPKLSNIAYYMTSSQYSIGAVIREAGAPVDCIIIINTGAVKQLQGALKGRLAVDASEAETLTRRLPLLAFSVLGRGSVLGETEMHLNQPTFRYTYTANSNDCEVFMMPLNVYVEHAATPEMRASEAYIVHESIRRHTNNVHETRIQRAVTAVREIAVSEAEANDERKDLLRMLPLLVDGLDVDDTRDWDPSLNKNARPRGFRYEKATAASFLKVPEIAVLAGHTPSSAVNPLGAVGLASGLPPPGAYAAGPPPTGSPRRSTTRADGGVSAVGGLVGPNPTAASSSGTAGGSALTLHFRNRLVAGSGSGSGSDSGSAPGSAGAVPPECAPGSRSKKSPRVQLPGYHGAGPGLDSGKGVGLGAYYQNKKFHQPSSEKTPIMRFKGAAPTSKVGMPSR